MQRSGPRGRAQCGLFDTHHLAHPVQVHRTSQQGRDDGIRFEGMDGTSGSDQPGGHDGEVADVSACVDEDIAGAKPAQDEPGCLGLVEPTTFASSAAPEVDTGPIVVTEGEKQAKATGDSRRPDTLVSALSHGPPEMPRQRPDRTRGRPSAAGGEEEELRGTRGAGPG